MERYRFEAINKEGKRYHDFVEADNRQKALLYLQGKNTTIIRLKKENNIINFCKHRGNKNEKFQINFCKQISVMLSAGIPILESVRVLNKGHKQKEQECCEQILAALQRGEALSEAMKNTNHYFSEFMISVIKAGEISGNLDKSLGKLHELLQKNYERRQKLRTAMIYPVFLCVLSILMVSFLLYQVIPVFGEVFAGFDAELPATTRFLLDLSDNFYLYFLYLLGGGSLFYVFWQLMYKIKSVGIKLDYCKLKLPVWGKLLLRNEQSLFFTTLAMLVQSGIRVNYGIELMKSMTHNMYLKFFYESVLKKLSQGYSLGSCMEKEAMFPAVVMSMINAGESTGELPKMLNHAGNVCQAEADKLAERIYVLAEPVIIIVIGVIVGFIVLSTVLPVLDLMTVM